MNRERLLQNPLPVDRVALRVVRKAKPEQLWAPMPKHVETKRFSKEVLPTGPINPTAPKELQKLVGKRRGKLRIVGYAAEQTPGRAKGAKWVVRCDCGNYEHRKRILRWLGTDAPDQCEECRNRDYLMHGEGSTEKAQRRSLSLQSI